MLADVVGEVAREVERLGYTSFWVNHMPHADGLAALVAAAATTSIQVGVGVLPLDQRTPAVIAQQIESSGLPHERLLLGVGSGDSRDALAVVAEGVQALRREQRSKIIVGALGPRMSALAGATADGVLFNWLTPDHAEHDGRRVVEAAESAGRPRPLLMAYVRCGVTPAAHARLQAELAHYDGVPQFRRHLERMGVDAPETCVLASDAGALQAGIAQYEAVLDETIVRAVVPGGHRDGLVALAEACAP